MSLKGTHPSVETRAKMSQARKKAWDEGKYPHTLSEETRAKLSAALMGHAAPFFSAEARERSSIAHKGKRLSQSAKAKISEANKRRGNKPPSRLGKHNTPEAIQKQRKTYRERFALGLIKPSYGHLGRHHTQEAKTKVSNAQLGRSLSDQTRRKISIAGTGRVFSQESRNKIAESVRQTWANNPERRKAQSQRLKEAKFWLNPEYVQKQMRARGVKPNKAEKQLDALLQKYFPGQFKYVGDGQIIIAGKCPDFINVNGSKQIIELYGDYWHKDDNPEERKDLFRQFGYDTLIIRESELKDEGALISRVPLFLGGS